jgi:DNA-binding transcriptional regulator YdaS (Cro superfamily)
MKLSTWIAEERGRAAELASDIGLTKPSNPVLIYQWSGGLRPVPIERCVPIEQATGGAVRRWDLRPDDWHRIWPELIGAEGAPAVPAESTEVA